MKPDCHLLAFHLTLTNLMTGFGSIFGTEPGEKVDETRFSFVFNTEPNETLDETWLPSVFVPVPN